MKQFRILLQVVFLQALQLLLLLPPLYAQQSTGTDPKHPDWQWFPILDTMHGTLKVPGRNEQFGREIHALGDINGDSIMDFAVNRLRIDTQFTLHSTPPFLVTPNEVLVFKGVKGKLPSAASGERIGPTELNAEVKFLAAGDWDHDSRRDLCVWIHFIDDTSFGNVNRYNIGRVVIFWGRDSGDYSIADTTILPSPAGSEIWLAAQIAIGSSFDGDAIDDLLIRGGGGLVAGVPISTAKLHIYQGQSGGRWGRNGVPCTPSWRWWNPPEFNTLGPLIDQDGDGALDIPLHLNQAGSLGDAGVAVLYGIAKGGFPDTNNIEAITFEHSADKASIFSDVTGDGMPEILVDGGVQEMVKIYAGRRGQRLQEQYGSGNDDPQPGKGWWYRPWAELWMGHKLDDGWPSAGPPLPFLDGNRDGINDIWIWTSPYYVCYVSGNVLDSLIDGIIQLPVGNWPGDGNVARVWLGDITGSGIPSFAISSSEANGIVFYQPTGSLPETGVYRTLPHIPAGVESEGETMRGRDGETMGLLALPNPAQEEVRITWSSKDLAGEAVLVIRDVLGREVTRLGVPVQQGQAIWNPGEIVGGAYFITLAIDGHTETTRVILR